MKNRLESQGQRVSKRLRVLSEELSAKGTGAQRICAGAMAYSLGAGGKRIRPVLLLEFARICGGAEEKALDSACAVEMIHTFSLIHDDLPCMDNDDMRRGKPSCHKAYGEDMALLAGDALQCWAFDTVARDDSLNFEQRTRLIACLASASGVTGMTGGQAMDIMASGDNLSGEAILTMYSLKTGALIRAACEMGCICAGRYDMLPKVQSYGRDLGVAFQIVDDILDITADEKELGKPVRSDEKSGKATYAAVFGQETAARKAEELTKRAMKAAQGFPQSDFLVWLTEYLLRRTK